MSRRLRSASQPVQVDYCSRALRIGCHADYVRVVGMEPNVGAESDCHWKRKPAVVVRVVTDQVYSARGERAASCE